MGHKTQTTNQTSKLHPVSAIIALWPKLARPCGGVHSRMQLLQPVSHVVNHTWMVFEMGG